jgi:hypothetical protein
LSWRYVHSIVVFIKNPSVDSTPEMWGRAKINQKNRIAANHSQNRFGKSIAKSKTGNG